MKSFSKVYKCSCGEILQAVTSIHAEKNHNMSLNDFVKKNPDALKFTMLNNKNHLAGTKMTSCANPACKSTKKENSKTEYCWRCNAHLKNNGKLPLYIKTKVM